MLGQDGWFCCRPQPLDGMVETTDHAASRLLGEVYSRDYLRHELWHPYLETQSENLMMSNGHVVKDLSRWYWVNSDTWTYGESRFLNQICQQNQLLDFRGNWPGMSASVSASVECEHQHIVIIDW
jgi:hypothetical protein